MAARAGGPGSQASADKGLQWLVLDDFTAGIHSDGIFDVTTGLLGAALLSTQGKVSAIATAATVDCHALADGMLAPLPWQWLTPFAIGAPGTAATPTVAGLHVSPYPIDGTVANPLAQRWQVFYALDFRDTVGGTHRQTVNRLTFPTGGGVNNDNLVNSTRVDASQEIAVPVSMTDYRASNVSPTTPGTPGVAMAGQFFELSSTGFWKFFPDPANIATNVPANIGASPAMQRTLGHQGRALGFNGLPGSASQQGKAAGVVNIFAFANDQIFWTNGNLLTLDNAGAPSAFSTEIPGMYGAIGSSNASELILVRGRRGALIVTGDLDNPFIIQYSAVQGTDGCVVDPCFTPRGMTYGALDGSVYAYSGGQQALDLAPQLAPGFWCPPMFQGIIGYAGQFTVGPAFPYLGQFAYSHGYLFTPNQYVLDLEQKSWWRHTTQLDQSIPTPNTRNTMFYYAETPDGNIVATPQQWDNVTTDLLNVGTYGLYPPSYQFESHPFPITDGIDYAELNELVIVLQPIHLSAISGTANAQVTVVFFSESGSATGSVTFTPAYTNTLHVPQIFRFPTQPIKGTHAQVSIFAQANSDAAPPCVREIRLGVRGQISLTKMS